MRTSVFVLSSMLLLSAAPVFAKDVDLTADTGHGPARRFGLQGEWALSSDAALSISHQSGSTELTLAPAVDYFVIPNLSVGGFISLYYAKSGPADTTIFSIGPRVGYNVPFSDLFSLWPKIGFSFSHTTNSSEIPIARNQSIDNSTTNNGITLNLFVPVMIHPAEHFFAGFGPFLDASLSGDNKFTRYGLKLTLGGWLD
jgi:hypothetical protein